MPVSCVTDAELSRTLCVSPGRLDTRGSEQFLEVVGEKLSEPTPYLLVDLTGCDLLTSAGVGVLVRVLVRAQTYHGGLSLFGATRRVRTVLETVNLVNVLNLRETPEQARSRLREMGAG